MLGDMCNRKEQCMVDVWQLCKQQATCVEKLWRERIQMQQQALLADPLPAEGGRRSRRRRRGPVGGGC